jgi:hypothetical protein
VWILKIQKLVWKRYIKFTRHSQISGHFNPHYDAELEGIASDIDCHENVDICVQRDITNAMEEEKYAASIGKLLTSKYTSILPGKNLSYKENICKTCRVRILFTFL